MIRSVIAALAGALTLGATYANARPLSPEFLAADWPGAPFSEAVRTGDFLILSGQIGETAGKVPFGDESRSVMNRIGATLGKHGASFDDVVKCTVMLTDMALLQEFNAVYIDYFKPDRLPARSAFGASDLAANARVEVECWAYRPQADR